TGKSAQIPLYVWLPDAMEGPTPVSALIHAATMVTAGVYMVARCQALYALAPVAMAVVAIIGLMTAFLAATMAMAQYDIKRVLAYSTISQLGLMFLACGVGAFDAGIFHLFTHAFFKALLFLCAGSVMHALAGEVDMRRLGGLWRRLPVTFGTFLVATLAIGGCPPFAGFFSKDEILAAAFHGPCGHPVLGVAAMLVAAMTAFYMFRLLFRVFLGQCRADEKTLSHAHESPPSMAIPMAILAALSLVAGWVNVPVLVSLGFVRDLEAAVQSAEHARLLPVASVALAALGAAAAWVLYVSRPGLAASLAARWPRLVSLLRNKWYVDEAYDALFVRPGHRLAVWLWRVVDMGLIDGGANGIRWLVEAASELGRRLQVGHIRSYATSFALGVVVLLWWLLLR
ncbi:MAG: NADH-quinone oxidoreductase subunit L, partial [Verrucomicrobia bacterium]|nr:NADH-quinone oxidoreductase subunit L [Verrucomicrobiota bacterium]